MHKRKHPLWIASDKTTTTARLLQRHAVADRLPAQRAPTSFYEVLSAGKVVFYGDIDIKVDPSTAETRPVTKIEPLSNAVMNIRPLGL